MAVCTVFDWGLSFRQQLELETIFQILFWILARANAPRITESLDKWVSPRAEYVFDEVSPRRRISHP